MIPSLKVAPPLRHYIHLGVALYIRSCKYKLNWSDSVGAISFEDCEITIFSVIKFN